MGNKQNYHKIDRRNLHSASKNCIGRQLEDHVTNQALYGSLPKVTTKIRERRIEKSLTGHCKRHDEEMASKLVLWQPDRSRANRGRTRTTLIDTLLHDTGCSTTQELSTAMMDRERCKSRIHEVRAGARQR